MLGYSPKLEKGDSLSNFYYWPFYLNGKVFASSLFDSMISLSLDDINHMSTLKKLANSDYFIKCENNINGLEESFISEGNM